MPEDYDEEELAEIQRLGEEAFPGVPFDARGFKELFRHCYESYGMDGGGEDMPLSKKPMLEVVMGVGKKK